MSDTELTILWTAVGSLAAVGATIFAGVQIWLSRRDANSRAVFEHLREIDARIQDVWHVSIPAVQAELISFYRHGTAELSADARKYLALLNSLDLLAFAVSKGLVTRGPTEQYLRTLLQPDVVSQSFLKEFQECCGQPGVYEHLYEYFTEHRAIVRDRKTN